MPKTRLISPGSIPNHKLLKNLQLRDSYISNDGGDEGIRITDAGLVGIGVTDPDSGLEVMNTGNLLKLSYDDDDYLLFEGQAGGDTTAQSTGGISFQVDTNQYFGIREGAPGSSGVSRYSFGTSDPTEFKINAASDINDNCTYSVAEYGATTITSTNNRVEHILYAPHLILKPEKVGSVIINKDVTGTLTSTYTALQIDYDHTGISASGQTMAGIGLDLDMNCESVTHVGTVNQTGIDLDIVAATDGTQRNVCIDVKCSGGDEATGLTIDTDGGTQSTGIYIDNKNGTTDFKNVSSADATDYFTINTIAAGATTLATVDTTVGATAHLTLNIDGDINLKPNGNDVFFNDVADTGENIFRFNVANSYMNIHDDSDVANYFQIAVADEGATTISTVDDGSAVGHLTLDADGDITLDPHEGKIYLAQSGDNYGYFSHTGSYTHFKLYENGGATTSDFFDIRVSANGATALITHDNADTNAHLQLDADGDIMLDPATGITHFRDAGDSDDAFKITVVGGTGATTLETVSAATPGDGHLDIVADGHIKFPASGVGFRAVEGVFSTSGVIGDGNDSTDIDFRAGNKHYLELTNNIDGVVSSEYLNLIFPAVSGNFLLVLGQDGTGTRLVNSTAWIAYQSDGSTKALNNLFSNGTDGAIRWAGGSAPTLTTTAYKADIISIFWHADSETAFAVISQNF